MSKLDRLKQTLSREEQERLFGELRARGKTPPNWEALLRLLARKGQVERLCKDEEEGAPDAWETFVEVVEEEVLYQREIAVSVGGSSGAPASRSQEDAVPVAVGEKDHRAAELCAELLAQDATEDPVVVAFRERELGGDTLTPDAAKDYLQQHERGSPGYLDLPRTVAHQLLLDEPEQKATLGDVAAYLAWRYPWDGGQAAWFLLTDDVPVVQPVSLSVEADDTFTIKVHPWTTKESLKAAHDAMFTPWKGSSYPPKSEALDLVAFVLEHSDEAGRRSKTWEELQELWNERFPARKFKTYSAVRRAYNRARDLLAPRRL